MELPLASIYTWCTMLQLKLITIHYDFSLVNIMTSSNGNIFRFTGHLCGEFTGHCGEFPAQRLVTRSFDVFFDLRLIKRLNKQSRGWWFETPSRPLWSHCNEILMCIFLCLQVAWFRNLPYRNPIAMPHCKKASIGCLKNKPVSISVSFSIQRRIPLKWFRRTSSYWVPGMC